jgi:hypothetical protein
MSILQLFEDSPYRRVERYAQSRYTTGFLDVIVFPPNKERLLLPAKCQRELCWTVEQYRSFIIHSIETRSAGNFILYRHEDDYNSRYILDGQHRIHAWKAFKEGIFNIHFEGREIAYSDFTPLDLKLLDNNILCTIQDVVTADAYDDEVTELIYNRFNFSGVAHERKETKDV